MERLISSSSISSWASISKPRFLVSVSSSPASIAATRSGFVLFRRPGFKPAGEILSNYDGPHHPRTFLRSLNCLGNYALPALEGKDEHSSLDTRSEAGRDLAGVFPRKVAPNWYQRHLMADESKQWASDVNQLWETIHKA